MSKFPDFYDIIDDIAEHCRMDLIGPIEENEVIEFEDPLSRYSLGILWALPKEKGSEPIEITNSLEEMFEDDLEENEIFKNSSVFKPSSMGVSCTVSEQDELEISFTYAIYHHSEQMIEEDGKTFKQHYYSREPQKFSEILSVPNQISNRMISKDEKNILIYLHVRKINDDGSKLVTISILNRNRTGTEFIETNTTAIFQCQLSVKSQKGFLPVYKRNIHRSFEEEKNDMLYDSINNYSYGHGCSSIHVENEGIVTEIRSEFIPQYRMLQMMPRLFDNAEYFYMKYWENPDRNTACETLHHFIAQYEEWFSQLQTQTELIQKYPEPAKHSFSNIQKCIERLHSGVDILQNHDTAWKAFLYMNEAMLLQRIHTKSNSSPNTVSWYPFQLAYILQIIPDIVNYESPFHEVVDLLWFPTGGGKTEAYLGLSAFTIFYRRLNHETSNANGVTIIMRYTLRLLTLQQFERATALVCACEHMRRKYHISGEEISIGLWIGSGVTPNHIKDATETLKKIKEDSTAPIFEANPMQITECPWCKTKIGVGGYEIELETMNISCCNNPKCEFHKHLPIYQKSNISPCINFKKKQNNIICVSVEKILIFLLI
ncbi:MAG: hypothetical protein V3G42_10260 [Oscillospiraceae bacterium]